jgi:hypothetical protein
LKSKNKNKEKDYSLMWEIIAIIGITSIVSNIFFLIYSYLTSINSNSIITIIAFGKPIEISIVEIIIGLIMGIILLVVGIVFKIKGNNYKGLIVILLGNFILYYPVIFIYGEESAGLQIFWLFSSIVFLEVSLYISSKYDKTIKREVVN